MNKARWLLQQGGLYLAALAVALFVLAPFAWLIISSLASGADLLTKPLRWWPAHAGLARYITILTTQDTGSAAYVFRHALWNSARTSLLATGLALAVGLFAAYALARFEFRGRRVLTLFFLSTYMLPPIALIVSVYMLMGQLHLRDTVTGLALVYSSFVTPFVVWIMRGYFSSIPKELEEAAEVDGCSRLGAFWRVAVPLSLPGLVTTIIFAILMAWDEFLYALILTSSVDAKTIPVAIAEFSGQHMVDYGMIAAGGVLAALPPVLVALVLQRHIIAGLSAGAVKG
ncbi:MAG: carbohydrate ABC transporter permease [Bacillota bacterium]